MSEVEWTIKPENIRWSYHSQVLKEEKTIFEDANALALLLINEVLSTNSYWWRTSTLINDPDHPGKLKSVPLEDTKYTEEDAEQIAISVLCNDVFAWGVADAEPLPYDEIEAVYDHFIKDPHWGTAIWCMKRRKMMPQKPVEDLIRKDGIWDLDALQAEFGLEENYYDKLMRERFEEKKE